VLESRGVVSRVEATRLRKDCLAVPNASSWRHFRTGANRAPEGRASFFWASSSPDVRSSLHRLGHPLAELNEKRDDLAAVHEGLHLLVGRPFGGSCRSVEDERKDLDIGDGVEENAWATQHP